MSATSPNGRVRACPARLLVEQLAGDHSDITDPRGEISNTVGAEPLAGVHS
jgi:hypothetical protein